MAIETMSGEGRYRVSLHNGQVMLVEIWRDGQRMAFGTALHRGPCARCGTEIPVFLPDNDSAEICDACDQALEKETW